MDIKMIVTDLDNTLLRKDKTISEYTRAILEGCRASGRAVIFATARPPRTIKRFGLTFEADAMVCHNGAMLVGVDDGAGQDSISGAQAGEIIRKLLAADSAARISMEMRDKLYANFDISGYWGCDDYIYDDYDKLPEYPVEKLLIGIKSPDDIEHIASLLPAHLYVERCEATLALIMNRNATKLKGIRRVAAARGIDIENIVAFGDDYSDIEMLKACGRGVAVRNALDAVKAAADEVCLSCDDDGVAHWLEARLLS